MLAQDPGGGSGHPPHGGSAQPLLLPQHCALLRGWPCGHHGQCHHPPRRWGVWHLQPVLLWAGQGVAAGQVCGVQVHMRVSSMWGQLATSWAAPRWHSRHCGQPSAARGGQENVAATGTGAHSHRATSQGTLEWWQHRAESGVLVSNVCNGRENIQEPLQAPDRGQKEHPVMSVEAVWLLCTNLQLSRRQCVQRLRGKPFSVAASRRQ